ncbi:Ypk2p [Fusarium mundagurra]|uniref:Ypk2p n=1 Tax=Fusarium mundagurra TaxID=1567541 RepID=A0A8H6DM01_9HYPO|nr:Ypk2p [Fusarium mundagurra]
MRFLSCVLHLITLRIVMDMHTEVQDGLVKGPDPVPFYIPLMPFERAILSQLQIQIDQESYATYNGERYSVSKVFEEWKWAKLTKSAMKDDLGHDGEYLMKDYGGNRTTGYNSLLHLLTHTGGVRNLARVQQLRSVNECFLFDLGDKAIEDVEVQPWPEDLALWQTVSVMWQLCGQYWKFDRPIRRSEGFVIFELIRKFTIQWKWPDNMYDVDQALLGNPQFNLAYDVQRTLVGFDLPEDITEEQIQRFKFEECHITKTPDPKKLPKVCLRAARQTYPVEDPRSYVHCIPWAELTSISDEELRCSRISLEIPFSKTSATDSWVIWSPPLPGFAWNHHLHSEDEVYQYHVIHDWASPDHYVSRQPDKILFRMRQLEETEFIGDLKNYWQAWNDCALTAKDGTGHLVLLETIPGIRYRSRRKHQDEAAARQYFRNVVEAHANGSLDQPILADLAGIDATQILQFQHSLRFITEDEFINIVWKSPLGAGQNGKVFKATWKKPRGILVRPSEEKDVLDVVLKEVLPRQGSAEQPSKKLLKELYLTYISLGAQPTACVKFLGIARLSPTQQEPGQHSPTTTDKYYLVFERATERSLVTFLEGKLKGESFFQAWDSVIQAMSSIAAGLDTLHKHDVLHRDLHDENILVTLKEFPNDPINPFEYQYMLSDVGEGKMLNPYGTDPNLPEGHYASYGNPQYRAPEVNGSSGWTKAADVWAFGMLCVKLLEMRRSICGDWSKIPPWVLDVLQKQHPDKDFSPSSRDVGFIAPWALNRCLEPCFRHDPDERPDIHTVALGLDEVSSEFYVEDKEQLEQNKNVKWSYWNWNKTRAAGIKGKEPGMGGGEDSLDLSLGVVKELNLDDVPGLD